jgi:hypothetical protein
MPSKVLESSFFETARERYQMMLRRQERSGPGWGPEGSWWTEDPILASWRFCNVHREDDRTTVWFRDNIRSKLHGLKVVQATVAFRWFNRIETGEIIKDMLLEPKSWNWQKAHKRLHEQLRSRGHAVVTGAYIINGMPGYAKLEGVLACIDRALPVLDRLWPQLEGANLETAHTLLHRNIVGFGSFMAYEVVSDLRWTDALTPADALTWAVPGPGCARGLGRVMANDPNFFGNSLDDRKTMFELMHHLLYVSRTEWPREWRRWEMREVEHWACEFDKYERARGGSRLKRRYP